MTSPQPILPLCVCRDPLCKIPYGYCHCKCGEKTDIATRSRTKDGSIKGFPRKYIYGHYKFDKIIPKIEEAKPFKIDGFYCRLIPLTGGFYAIVWESDYRWLMQWKWNARRSHGKVYAVRKERASAGRWVTVRMHCQILGRKIRGKRESDHENGITLDNRRNNLRGASHPENMWNKGKRSDNSSGYKGVSWHKNRQAWQARIGVCGVRHHLGYYKTKEEAYAAYCAAAIKYHGKFARVA